MRRRAEEFQRIKRLKKHVTAWRRATKSKKQICSTCGHHHTKCRGPKIEAKLIRQGHYDA